MKISEAKEIVGSMIKLQMQGFGIETEPVKTNLREYSLEDLLKANKLVASNRERSRKMAEYHRQKGHKTNGRSVPMIIADRGIAAMYTMLNFHPSSEAIMSFNGLHLAVLSDEDLKQP